VRSGTSVLSCTDGDTIFRQGDASQHVMYIQSGGVKLSVLSKTGKEAMVVALLGPGDFFGEGCLAGQPPRAAPPGCAIEYRRRSHQDRRMSTPAVLP